MKSVQASKRFIDSLGLKNPIVQSPMAGVSTVKLASIVTNNGGLGSIPFAAVDIGSNIEPIIKQVEEFKSLTNGSNTVNLNFFSHDFETQIEPTVSQANNWHKLFKLSGIEGVKQKVPKFSDSNISVKKIEKENPEQFQKFLDAIIKLQPKVVSFHFGHPSQESLRKLQENNILVFVCATSVKESRHLIDIGVDAIVCQGYEAGGHRGNFLTTQLLDENLSTFALFKQVIKITEEISSKIFIIPAGGILDGYTAADYLKLGASAVQIGTPFITTKESSSNDFIKNEIMKGKETTTIMTQLISGKPARTLKTPFIERIILANEKLLNQDLPPYGYAYNGFKTLQKDLNDENIGFYLAGQNYHFNDPVLNTKEVVYKFVNQLKEAGYDTFKI